jgi:hypothetical protein
MFVLSRNGKEIYPNEIIMLNAAMIDVLNQQHTYISANKLDDQILKTQIRVAGILDEEPVRPSVPVLPSSSVSGTTGPAGPTGPIGPTSYAKPFVTGEDIIKTQLRVAGILDEEPVRAPPSTVLGTTGMASPATGPVSDAELLKYKSLSPNIPVTQALLQRNKDVLSKFNSAIRLIEDNLKLKLSELEKTRDEELLKLLRPYADVFKILDEVIQLTIQNNLLLSDAQILLINENLTKLLNSLTLLTTKA